MENARGLASAVQRVKKCDSLIFLSYLFRDAHPIMRPMGVDITRTTDGTVECRRNYVEDSIAG